MTIAENVLRLAENDDADPRDVFKEPQAITDAVTAPYEARLTVLQRWRARAVGSDDPAALRAVDAALKALETHAALAPTDATDPPKSDGYGATALHED